MDEYQGEHSWVNAGPLVQKNIFISIVVEGVGWNSIWLRVRHNTAKFTKQPPLSPSG